MLEKVLGQGRFATCFLAQKEGERVVMKLVKPRKGVIDGQAVWSECRALQVCDHSAVPQWLGIVNMDDSGLTFDGGSARSVKPYFIVEEFMPGSSLTVWLRKGKHVFCMDEIRSIALQLSDALTHFEQRGLVHGDLRPANVLYDGERVSLIDFGLSLEAHDASAFSLDRDGLASVILFLLYSDRSRIRPGVKATWREELILQDGLHQLLEDLFDEDHPWAGAEQVAQKMEEAFR